MQKNKYLLLLQSVGYFMFVSRTLLELAGGP